MTVATAFKQDLHRRLDQIEALPRNWDREGAPPIDRDVIAGAKALIDSIPEALAPRPEIVPTPTGNLQFEWQIGSRELELEVESRNVIRYLRWHPAAGIKEEDAYPLSDLDRTLSLIRWVCQGRGNA